jgi:hypothetical protein
MIPNQFKLFNKPWTIRPSQFNELRDDMGLCMTNNLQVIYDSSFPYEEIEHIIMHELVHAIEQTLQLDLTERQVDLMALGIIDLIKHNPELIAYYMENTDD